MPHIKKPIGKDFSLGRPRTQNVQLRCSNEVDQYLPLLPFAQLVVVIPRRPTPGVPMGCKQCARIELPLWISVLGHGLELRCVKVDARAGVLDGALAPHLLGARGLAAPGRIATETSSD